MKSFTCLYLHAFAYSENLLFVEETTFGLNLQGMISYSLIFLAGIGADSDLHKAGQGKCKIII